MAIGELCVRNVVCASPETTVVEAAQLMRHGHVGSVIIVDEGTAKRVPIGIVTDRDLVVEVVAGGLDPNLIKLGDLVLAPLTTIPEGAGHAEAIRLMAVKGVRRMPVVDADGALVGLLTLDDLLRQLAAPLAAISELAGRGRNFERLTRA
jgi:CBS domain-containing protein